MGLWGSKQVKDITIKNPESNSNEIYITQNALNSVMGETEPKVEAEPAPVVKPTSEEIEKRVVEYEASLLKNFDESTRRVEDLFSTRYQQMPVCVDLQKEVSDCYSEHSGKPLKCLDIANKFIKCVESERKKQLGNSFIKPTGLKTIC